LVHPGRLGRNLFKMGIVMLYASFLKVHKNNN
jgi:hypothetical protein